jgi:hypothetical protein
MAGDPIVLQKRGRGEATVSDESWVVDGTLVRAADGKLYFIPKSDGAAEPVPPAQLQSVVQGMNTGSLVKDHDVLKFDKLNDHVYHVHGQYPGILCQGPTS